MCTTSVAHLTNFSIEFFYAIFRQDAPPLFLHHGAKKVKNDQKVGKNSITAFFFWSCISVVSLNHASLWRDQRRHSAGESKVWGENRTSIKTSEYPLNSQKITHSRQSFRFVFLSEELTAGLDFHLI